MGSDDLNLRVLATSSDNEKERRAATKVLRLLERGRHWVLVVLLLGNVVSTLACDVPGGRSFGYCDRIVTETLQIVNESLPIFLDAVLGGGVAAVIASTIMIVIFGEIIPQAVSPGSDGATAELIKARSASDMDCRLAEPAPLSSGAA